MPSQSESWLQVYLMGYRQSSSPHTPSEHRMNLHLPEFGVPHRVNITGPRAADERTKYAKRGPGCIQHVWAVGVRLQQNHRNVHI